ncbi:hypothetical protein GTY64_05630 [Streptomyces sp. SID8376]|uniref:Uncharacterized protein n=1 Tax=Streptomyces tunisiensis TaxID=948699 RepID=A0ABP7Y851_9ACTN|nr:hypothetical protein [Streptomyces sp. SID8376]WSB92013.1 hypothetical protein OG805_16175 [Streptomyces cellulosae]
MVNAEVERICGAMADLCEPLHDAFARAGEENKKRNGDLTGRDYGWLTTHNVRGRAHLYLTEAELGVWKLTGKHRRNGELWVSDGGYRARILHAPSEKDVPPPGHNAQRRAFYANDPLSIFEGMEPLWGPANDRLLVLWRLDAATGAPAFRVVRPIGAWKYGRKEKIDIDFPLPQTASAMSDLAFQPTDAGIHLNIPASKEEGNAYGAGGISG